MKKNGINKIAMASSIFLALLVFSTIAFKSIPGEWVVPAAAKKEINPTKANDETLVEAKILYAKHCKSCHGKTGEGDGPRAGDIDIEMPDLSSEKCQSQSDGSLYYKTTVGRGEMPGFEKRISEDDDRWLLVNFMRTFK